MRERHRIPGAWDEDGIVWGLNIRRRIATEDDELGLRRKEQSGGQFEVVSRGDRRCRGLEAGLVYRSVVVCYSRHVSSPWSAVCSSSTSGEASASRDIFTRETA